jgi:signal transduction histidine kinase
LIRRLKEFAKRRWPALSLRTILFGTLLFVAVLPGLAAVFLRVYENTLVQQTEAELIAQGAVLAAAYKNAWQPDQKDSADESDRPAHEALQIDLRTNPTLPPLPDPVPSGAADPRALAAANRIEPVARDAAAVTLAAVRVLDARGIVLLGRGDVGRSYAAAQEVRRALAGRTATVLRERGDYEPRYMLEALSRASSLRVHHVRPVIDQGRVIGAIMLSRSPRGLFLGIYQDRGKILIGVAAIFAILVVLVGLLSRGISKPLGELSRATERVALGRTDVPDTPRTAAIEIRALYDNFRAMAGKIDQRSRYLHDFAAAVSHEFKTPIAGIKGALELLEEHGDTMSADQRRRFLANASADTDRLSRLVERLLDLARADMARIDEHSRADVWQAVTRAADHFRSADLTIEFAEAPALPEARITGQVLETVLEILLDNSRRAGAGTISIAAAHEDDHVCLTVADDGCGIPAADAERIFEPFFTDRRATGGTGLGLPIAASLLAASGGTIALVPSGRGATFSIRLAQARTDAS